MKKVLSVVLALLMLLSLATVAFASTTYEEKKNKGDYGKEHQMLPGESYRFVVSYNGNELEIESKNFKVEADMDKDTAKYVEATGSAGGCVYVKTKSTYAVDMDDPASIDIDFTLTARRDIKNDDGDVILDKGDEIGFGISYDFGNNIVYVEVEEDDPDNATTYNATTKKTAFASDDGRGWVNFDCGDIDVHMLMPRTGTVNFGVDDTDIEGIKKLSTSGSYECVTFGAKPKISGTATLSVNKRYDYVYSYNNGTLTQVNVTRNGSYNQWTVTDATLGAYVLSTTALSGTNVTAVQQPAASSSAAEVPASSSSAAPAAPSSAAPEASVAEPVEDPVEEPVEEPAEDPAEEPSSEVDITPAEPEEDEPAEAPVAEPEEKTTMLPIILLAVAAALVVAVLIALLVSRGGRRSRR